MLFTIDSTFELQESWLNQVKEMQIHCDQGLTHVQSNAAFGSQQPGENDSRLGSRNLISGHMPLFFLCHKIICHHYVYQFSFANLPHLLLQPLFQFSCYAFQKFLLGYKEHSRNTRK